MDDTNNSLMIEQKVALPNPFDSTPDYVQQNDSLFETNNISESLPITDTTGKKPNFPSVFPIVYHSINLEIPQKYSFITRLCYNETSSFFLVTLLTLIAECFSGQIESSMIVMWREIVLSLFILIICPAALVYGQYYPLYCAIRDERPNPTLIPFQFFTIFIFFFILVGIPGTGIIGIGYLIVCYRCGQLINKIFATLITIWHFFNFVIQFMLLFLISPINSAAMARTP
ncbi:hypothetical protein TRFO_27465 [Tritrichomonas foetus]|uniref:Uncharacterized protein n=1 Tax=Tritrichomonas foetus TaxID=1144522 RepID=A0A1J4K661_9EUKA|nr:hypothetical protein TRFO_27465 [Tritrichomonas foetus]|eukprot:OHT04957.1 hypothetical protein TRFO_27465 [Tritrichomonas foetus]